MYSTVRIAPRIIFIALIAGAAIGCSTREHVTVQRIEPIAPTQPTTTNDAAANSQNSAETVQYGEQIPTQQNAANTPSHNWQPGQKLEPFWISMTAESDRHVWDDKFQPGNAGNPVALSTMPNMPSQAPSRGDDTSEGLTHVTFAPQGADFDPCISRDGAFMVFASTQHRPTADIYLKTVGGRTVTQLTSDPANDVMPAISPDGQRVAFASNRNGNWDIYVMSVTGGQAVQITSDGSAELHPSWSPDGKKLSFCRMGEVSARWEMWVTDVNGSGTTEFVGFGLFPEWCPVPATGLAGRDKILFQRSRERGDRAFSLWTVDYKPGDTSSPTEIVTCTNAAAINASWSPDGARVVYATIDYSSQTSAGSGMGNTRLPNSNLWMTSIDGSQRVNLTSGTFMNLMPCWGADNRIYFVSDRTGLPNVWSIGSDKAIMAATGKPAGKITTEVVNVREDHAAPASHE